MAVFAILTAEDINDTDDLLTRCCPTVLRG